MKQCFLALALAIATSGAAAAPKWVKVASEADAEIFADTASIIRGKVVKMTAMRNLRAPAQFENVQYRSEEQYFEFDCEGRRIGQSGRRMRVGPMATDSPFHYFQSSPARLKPVASGSLDEKLWNVACVK
jgi:hypothetical protein